MCPGVRQDAGSARRTIRGRATWRRLVVVVPIGVLAIIGSASLYVFGLPSGVRGWFEWHSRAAISWVQNTRWSSLAAKRDRIVEVDPETGAVRRIVTTRSRLSFEPLVVTPDGRSAAAREHRANWFSIDLRRRARHGSAGPADRSLRFELENAVVAGFVGPRVLVATSDAVALKDRIGLWDPDTGDLEILHESDMYMRADGRPSGRAVVQVSTDPLRVISTPCFSENYEKDRAGKPEFVIHDIDLDRAVSDSMATRSDACSRRRCPDSMHSHASSFFDGRGLGSARVFDRGFAYARVGTAFRRCNGIVGHS